MPDWHPKPREIDTWVARRRYARAWKRWNKHFIAVSARSYANSIKVVAELLATVDHFDKQVIQLGQTGGQIAEVLDLPANLQIAAEEGVGTGG